MSEKQHVPDYTDPVILLSHLKAAHGWPQSVSVVSSDEYLCSLHNYEHTVHANKQDHYHNNYFAPGMLNKPPVNRNQLAWYDRGDYMLGKGTPYGERETTNESRSLHSA